MRKQLLILPLMFGTAVAQSITMQPIEVDQNQTAHTAAQIRLFSSEQAKAQDAKTLQQRLEKDVSFSRTIDNKGEWALSFRGMGFRATEYFEDGIPLYRTPNGFVDPKFVMTQADLSLNDGSVPGELGVSAMGAEVSIASHMPQKALETALFATASTNENFAHTSAGTMQERFYLEANAALYDRNAFRISSDYPTNSLQPGAKRENSDKHQTNVSLKAGWFPNDRTHLGIKVASTRADYGIPHNVHSDESSPPVWNAYGRINDKSLDSLYLYGDYADDDLSVTLRAYADHYEDIYDIYDAPSYLHKDPSVFYNDHRYGAIAKAAYTAGHQTHAVSFQYERNDHERTGGKYDTAHFRADTLRAAYRYRLDITPQWHFDSALEHVTLDPIRATDLTDNTMPSQKSAWNAQVALGYRQPRWQIDFGAALKHRMPSQVEMFSLFPWHKVDPTIKPEESRQLTLAYSGTLDAKNRIGLSLYHYRISDLIVKENQYVSNHDKATHYGAEVRFESDYFKRQHIAFSYAYAHAKESDGTPLEFVPGHQLTLADTLRVTSSLSLYGRFAYVGTRYTDNSATYARELHKLSAYHTLDFQLQYCYSDTLTARLGVKNLFDTDYEWQYGFPAEGRSLYFSIDWRL